MPGLLGSYKAGLGRGGTWRVHFLIAAFRMVRAMGHTGPGSCQRAMYSVKVTQAFLLPEQAGDGDVLFCFYRRYKGKLV